MIKNIFSFIFRIYFYNDYVYSIQNIMKKIWLLTTLLVAGLLLTGCNKLNSEIDEIRALELAKTKEWRIELCNNKILAEVDLWATNFVWEEISYSEWDEEDWNANNYIYFIWSNWEDKVYGCSLGQHWKFIKLFPIDQEFLNSEEYQQLGELREAIKSSWEQPQRINDYPEETGKENILVTTEEPMDVSHVINLKLWDKSFDVTLEDNTATEALLEKLKEWDIVVNAQEYWGFEKVWYLWFKLPTEDINITTQLWDLVLYDWNQISLFYNSNSWSYTKLWKVQKITESDFWDWGVTLVFSLLK